MRFLTLLLVLPTLAAAGPRPCGDDVDGRGTSVPCACGDLLVSSRTLDESDPVTREVCAGTGLVVRVAPGRGPAVLDLGGQRVRGLGPGVGIHVVGGGPGGLTLRGPGTVEGFDVGVLARGDALARATDVAAVGNATDGFVVSGSGYVVARCEAARNRRDGFVLRGSAFRVDGNHARDNGRFGFALSGTDAAVGDEAGNEATGNARAGIRLTGSRHRLVRQVAVANGGSGIHARLARGEIREARASDNGEAGMLVTGGDVTVARSDARRNGAAGIAVHGSRMRDAGGNSAEDNGRHRRLRRAECRIEGACR